VAFQLGYKLKRLSPREEFGRDNVLVKQLLVAANNHHKKRHDKHNPKIINLLTTEVKKKNTHRLIFHFGQNKSHKLYT
jgi:hypothetical protein